MRIYIADDEMLALEYLERSIRSAAPDAELYTFNKGRLLLEQMEQEPCDVVFTDVEMPGMTGVELASALQKLNPRVNIIFVTGYSEYMSEALQLFASGYVLKPAKKEEIARQLSHLRFPPREKKNIRIQTFGNFAVFYQNKPVTFHMGKSRELLAYLVDRNGAVVSRREAFSVLWEDAEYSRNDQKMFSKVVHGLEEDLSVAGAEGLFIREKDGYRIDKTVVSCDLYEFLEGNKALFHGEYMEQYSWGENFKGQKLGV